MKGTPSTITLGSPEDIQAFFNSIQYCLRVLLLRLHRVWKWSDTDLKTAASSRLMVLLTTGKTDMMRAALSTKNMPLRCVLSSSSEGPGVTVDGSFLPFRHLSTAADKMMTESFNDITSFIDFTAPDIMSSKRDSVKALFSHRPPLEVNMYMYSHTHTHTHK